ncbi:Histone deacetylase superfamily protein [Ceratobasidium theobromae]|uniref:Histone deacetylase superfamily protein n=1 Tax=Ceratobasidium theobromae TaxID=1582974 RepID=A0A5N5QWJ1_9AGAM|nr:Histone deacetylase superfamily protein [Ceratobasidium theobromae]
MKLFYSDRCALHNPGFEILSGNATPYLESPSRMMAIMSHIAQDERTSSWSWENIDSSKDSGELPVDAIEAINRVHHPDYVEYLRNAYEVWVQDGGSKAAVLPETFPHPALLAAAKQAAHPKNLPPLAKADTFGSAVAAVQVVLQALRHLVAQANHNKYIETEGATGVSAPACLGVFALTFVPQASRPSQLIIGTCRRPPGHHAGSSVCGGYCFFNNVAIAAKCLQHETARATSEVPKVAILDIDYHHGNGTQEVFYHDPSVLYVSLHAEGDYPYFTGTENEVGDGPGTGFNLNIPLPQHRTGNEEYLVALRQGVDKISHYSPQWLIVSLGVDTYKDDPICHFKLTTECYYEIGREIGKLGLPGLFAMEGGYHLETLGANVGGVLAGFASASCSGR